MVLEVFSDRISINLLIFYLLLYAEHIGHLRTKSTITVHLCEDFICYLLFSSFCSIVLLVLYFYLIIYLLAELGDFNSEEHVPGYLSVFRFIPKQTEEFEREVGDLHRQHRFILDALFTCSTC